jgi:hypothetical protein
VTARQAPELSAHRRRQLRAQHRFVSASRHWAPLSSKSENLETADPVAGAPRPRRSRSRARRRGRGRLLQRSHPPRTPRRAARGRLVFVGPARA